jgi:N-acetylgalactosamine-N,N'-diacetylbacillosaminyl-diphospho-undecaprenol 4-alpha-N-acetylgalactosaminyltransferase
MIALRYKTDDVRPGDRELPSDSSVSARGLPPADPTLKADTAHTAATEGRTKQVMFMINSLAGGGAERVMCTLLRASQAEQRDFRIVLLLLDRQEIAYEVPRGIEVQQLDCRSSLIRSIWSVFQALRRARPDVTVSFLTRANIANVVAASLLRIPAIISERVNTSSHLGGGLSGAVARWIVRMTYPRARKVIAVSQGVADDVQASFGVARDRTIVIPNPIDFDAIRAQAEQGEALALQAPYVVAMGRLMPNKNLAMLIEAFARSGIGGTLLILGEGPERAGLEKRVAELGLQGRVIMPGFIDHPFATLRRASLYVSPSNAEGFPNALLEAMSVGLPVISTNCPSGPSEVLAELAREQVKEGVSFGPHGILVAPNDPDAMAEALRAMEDPGRRRDYGQRAARRAVDFGVQRAKDAYWSAIRETL